MDEVELHRFRALLEDQLRQIRASEASLSEATQPVELDQTRMGRLSRMDAIQSQALANTALRAQQDKRERVEAALQRLQAGDYGVCITCGGLINLERLAFDPTVVRCIACARAASRR